MRKIGGTIMKFREIRSSEKMTEKDHQGKKEKENKYLEIKPEGTMDKKEVYDYWNNIFKG